MMMSHWTPLRLDDEVVFTHNALLADPDASDFAPLTDPWREAVDDATRRSREVRDEQGRVDADRQVCDARLSDELMAFSVTLFLAVRRDRTDPTYLSYFPISASDVASLPQAEKVRRVKGWLSEYCDEPLEQHREALSTWVTKLEAALNAAETLRLRRRERDAAFAELCMQLTGDREQLHASLRQRSAERKLDRHWANRFFLKG